MRIVLSVLLVGLVGGCGGAVRQCRSNRLDQVSPSLWRDQLARLPPEEAVPVYLSLMNRTHPSMIELADVVARQGRSARVQVVRCLETGVDELDALDLIVVLGRMNDLEGGVLRTEAGTKAAVERSLAFIRSPSILSAARTIADDIWGEHRQPLP